jgi:hypothetical protein
MSSRNLLLLLAATILSGCAQPAHLAYDFGRSYTETMNSQADLSRPAIAMTNYHLYGLEAVAIRLNVEAATQEGGESAE